MLDLKKSLKDWCGRGRHGDDGQDEKASSSTQAGTKASWRWSRRELGFQSDSNSNKSAGRRRWCWKFQPAAAAAEPAC